MFPSKNKAHLCAKLAQNSISCETIIIVTSLFKSCSNISANLILNPASSPFVGVEAQTSGLSCIFSTNVTEEAKLIEDTIYIDLDKGAKYLAEQALQFKETQRKDKSSLIAERGFDIKKEARKLQNYYLNLLGKEYGTN